MRISPIPIRGHTIKWVIKSRLVGMTVDHQLSWLPHTLEKHKKKKKLRLLKKAKIYVNKNDFYLRVVLPSVNCGLILWGAYCNSDILDSLERLHCRAARIISVDCQGP